MLNAAHVVAKPSTLEALSELSVQQVLKMFLRRFSLVLEIGTCYARVENGACCK
jgi:hypothetical protein